MEWIVAAVIFCILAKQGLRKQNKEVKVKEACAAIAANSVLEICDLLEVEVIDTSKGSKKP